MFKNIVEVNKIEKVATGYTFKYKTFNPEHGTITINTLEFGSEPEALRWFNKAYNAMMCKA